MGNVDKVQVKGEFYNIVSPSAFGDYIETIGGACTNPSGYAKDDVFLALNNDVQNLYQATQAIAFAANIVVGTNCQQTSLKEVIKNSGGASSADHVSYNNSLSGLAADDVQEAIDEVAGDVSSLNSALSNKENAPTVLTQTLAASATTLTFTDASIGNNSRIRAYSDPFVLGLITDMTQSGTSVTLTCEAQASSVSVKLEVRN